MDDFQKRMAWEHGNIDYMGQDSFENIQRKLDSKMNVSKETADWVCQVTTDPNLQENGVVCQQIK